METPTPINPSTIVVNSSENTQDSDLSALAAIKILSDPKMKLIAPVIMFRGVSLAT